MAREDKTYAVDRGYAETRLSDARAAYLPQAEASGSLNGTGRNATVARRRSLRRFSQVSPRAMWSCALALGMNSAGAHDKAVKPLVRVDGSTRAVGDLSKLVAIKTAAQYTGKSMAVRRATDPITQAQRLIVFAESQRRR